jgi:N-acetylglutamate synthase
MLIRLMTSDDFKEVRRLWEDSDGVGLNVRDDSIEGLSRYLERNPRTCFVAERGGRLAGAILGGHDGRRGFIYHAAVSRTSRRQGIGKALVKAVLNALRDEGISKVALVVFHTNDAGHAFWQAQSFSERNDLIYFDKSLIDSDSSC